MVKISMYKNDNGALLVIWQTPNKNLIGEVYNDGVEKRGKNGKWDNRATFEGKDATDFRVCEYFGFDSSKPWWSRWDNLKTTEKKPEKGTYMMLSRVQEDIEAFFYKEGDCRYYNENRIWGQDIKTCVAKVREIWDSIPNHWKPIWFIEKNLEVWEDIVDNAYKAYPESGEKRIAFIKGYICGKLFGYFKR